MPNRMDNQSREILWERKRDVRETDRVCQREGEGSEQKTESAEGVGSDADKSLPGQTISVRSVQ